MTKCGTRYTMEFKEQIVNLYHAGSTVSNLSSEYGVTTVTIYKWIKELSLIQVSQTEELTLKDYDKLKKRIAQLETENEILKKATAIFARKQ